MPVLARRNSKTFVAYNVRLHPDLKQWLDDKSKEMDASLNWVLNKLVEEAMKSGTLDNIEAPMF